MTIKFLPYQPTKIKTAHTIDKDVFNVVLDDKPASNVFRFGVDLKGLFPSYQPHEVPKGHMRPDNVKGSYALFRLDRKRGPTKVMHVYRPEAIDRNGIKAWCEIKIKDGVLAITVPQSFLDNAVYPVVL